MKIKILCAIALIAGGASLSPLSLFAQIGTRFPSEKKIVPDPVTGVPLSFLTSTPAGDSKIYQTHPQWTADGKWLVFRSNRVPGQAMAVNEASGVIVQVTDKGYMGMLCNARLSMKLYIMRDVNAAGRGQGGSSAPAGTVSPSAAPAAAPSSQAVAAPGTTPAGAPGAAAAPDARGERRGGFNRPRGPFQIVEIDLAKVFADSEAGTIKPASNYERVCGTTPEGMFADGNMGLDANENFIYFRVSGDEVSKHLPEGQKPAAPFGPRGMGAGPTGLASMNLQTGEVNLIVTVPFQIGHVQTNPWVPGEIVFCWETGGKAPQRTWTVMADGTGLRPLYPEADYEWITHEAVITKDEVAIAIIALRRPKIAGQLVEPNSPVPVNAWGPAGGGDKPTGVGIVNLRTREIRLVGQVPFGDPGRSIWHVNGSPDGRWAVADDFQYRTWLIDRHSGEMILLSDNGHKTTAADHQHPTFSADSTRIEIQSAMLSENGRALNICVIPVPKTWLARHYSDKAPE
jgi:oligogalacturonide lyase